LLEKLADFDSVVTTRPLSEEESTRKGEVLLEYENLIKKEEIAWRQRSRTLWLKEGDRNTKNFHRIANAHKRYNNIDQLEVEGEITQDTNKIEKEVIDFYQRLYTETSRWRPTSNIPNCPVILSEEKEILQRNFEEDEVLRCLKLCAMDKAPGPEGFTMGFYIK